ncbi:MAG: hypothetical protein J6W48_01730 [Lachnospiraceae bacterium]|nr:hypothetical protein [Lachnospiraceae bacterium]
MVKYLIRLFLMLKARLKSPFTYVWILLMWLLLTLVNESLIPSGQPSEVLILNEAGEYGSRIMNILENREDSVSAYVYTETDDEGYLRDMVRKGRVECGFIFPEDMEERVREGDTRDMVTMVTSNFSLKSAAVRETVFAAMFRIIYADMVENAEEDIFEDPSAVKDYIRDKYEYLVASDEVFGLVYETVDIPEGESNEMFADRSDPIRGTAAVLLFILSLYSAGSFFGESGRFYRALKRNERALSMFLYELSSVAVPAVSAFILIRYFDAGSVSFFRDLYCFVLLLLFCCIWSVVFIRLFRRIETYLPAVSVLLFVSFVLCPVYFDPAKYVAVLGIVSRILPPSFYLYLL